jgi:hypothetical protein
MIDTELIFGYRALCIARGEQQSLPGFDENAYADNANFSAQSQAAAAQSLRPRSSIDDALAESLTEEAQQRMGTANGMAVSSRAFFSDHRRARTASPEYTGGAVWTEMKIHEITSYLEAWAPLAYQESYDNAGLIVGDSAIDVTGVLITLDVTEAVVDEAIQKGCNLIVAASSDYISGIEEIERPKLRRADVIKAIKNDVAIYALTPISTTLPEE